MWLVTSCSPICAPASALVIPAQRRGSSTHTFFIKASTQPPLAVYTSASSRQHRKCAFSASPTAQQTASSSELVHSKQHSHLHHAYRDAAACMPRHGGWGVASSALMYTFRKSAKEFPREAATLRSPFAAPYLVAAGACQTTHRPPRMGSTLQGPAPPCTLLPKHGIQYSSRAGATTPYSMHPVRSIHSFQLSVIPHSTLMPLRR